MLANMVCSLFEKGEIRTTVVKAKEARRFADKMITYGKKGDLHHRRLAVAKLRDKQAVRLLFEEVSPRYFEREGGYTRIIRLGRRIGDAAEMCLLQLVEEEVSGGKKKKSKEQIPEKTAEPATEKEAEEEKVPEKTETPASEDNPVKEKEDDSKESSEEK
jgi:large subunit ribosomal protein L17